MKRTLICLTLTLVASFSATSWGQQAPAATPPKVPATPAIPQQAAPQRAAAPQRGQAGQQPDMGAILVRGLRETQGCMGVKTCQWDDGKRSIVAWFEDKDSAATWYHSATHQAMIGDKTEGYEGKKEPMEHIADGDAPIMVIASLTMARKPELPGMKLPISQISIELFRPLPGGAQMGGRVTPVELEIPHMKNYTPENSKPAKIESDKN